MIIKKKYFKYKKKYLDLKGGEKITIDTKPLIKEFKKLKIEGQPYNCYKSRQENKIIYTCKLAPEQEVKEQVVQGSWGTKPEKPDYQVWGAIPRENKTEDWGFYIHEQEQEQHVPGSWGDIGLGEQEKPTHPKFSPNLSAEEFRPSDSSFVKPTHLDTNWSDKDYTKKNIKGTFTVEDEITVMSWNIESQFWLRPDNLSDIPKLGSESLIYNVNNNTYYNDKYRLDKIREKIMYFDPDILCIQEWEVNKNCTMSYNFCMHLGTILTAMNYTVLIPSVKSDERNKRTGKLIKIPIPGCALAYKQSEKLNLYNYYNVDDNDRIVRYDFNFNGKELYIFNCHFFVSLSHKGFIDTDKKLGFINQIGSLIGEKENLYRYYPTKFTKENYTYNFDVKDKKNLYSNNERNKPDMNFYKSNFSIKNKDYLLDFKWKLTTVNIHKKRVEKLIFQKYLLDRKLGIRDITGWKDKNILILGDFNTDYKDIGFNLLNDFLRHYLKTNIMFPYGTTVDGKNLSSVIKVNETPIDFREVYSNYKNNFALIKLLLDYFYYNKLHLIQFYLLPKKDSKLPAMPNKENPSDHLPLVMRFIVPN